MSAKCIRWPGFVPIRVFLLLCHRRRVAGLSMLYKVNSNSNYCLFSELPSASTRVRTCRPRFECGMTFLTLFDPGTLDGFKGAVNRWLLPWVVCCESNLHTTSFFLLGPGLLVLKIIIIMIITITRTILEPRPSHFCHTFEHPFSHIFRFRNLFP